MTIDLNTLEALAKAATPGPWDTKEGPDFSEILANSKNIALVGSQHKDAAFIAAANPAMVLELIEELREKNKLLEEIFDDCGDKNGGACPVCHIYTHKHWCWYPHLAKMLGKPLDENDKRFLADLQKYEELK